LVSEYTVAVLIFACAVGTACGSSSSTGASGGGGGGACVADGGQNCDGSTTPFCAGQSGASFCSDFDKDTRCQLPGEWNTLLVETGSSGPQMWVSDETAPSCPNSLRIHLPMAGAMSGRGELLEKDLSFAANQHETVLDLEVDLPDAKMSGVLFFELTADTSGAIVRFEHDAGTASWSLGGYAYNTSGGATALTNLAVPLPAAPRTGAWNHMILDVVYDKAGTATLTYDGADGATHTAVFNGGTASGLTMPTTAKAIIGMSQTGATEAPFTIHYDNVLVTMK
jgi:hypothetical protein